MPAYVASLQRFGVTTRRAAGHRCQALPVPLVLADIRSDSFGAVTNAVQDASASAVGESVAALNSAGVDASSLPTEYIAGGVAAVVLLGLGVALSGGSSGEGFEVGTSSIRKAEMVRKNCVLVFGSGGGTGLEVVKALLESGRNVVAAFRSRDLKATGLKDGPQPSGAVLFSAPNVDVTKPNTLSAQLFKGVTQVVIATGARSRQDGKGFENNQGPEQVDAAGVENVVKKAVELLPRAERIDMPIMQASDFSSWEARDDVVMRGTSASTVTVAEGSSVAEWSGKLVTEGGGFCGIVSTAQACDLSQYDGLKIRVKGGGETFKFNIKTQAQESEPTQAYQATFDTVAGDWVNVSIPWHEFVPVERANYNPSAAPLDPSKIGSLGLVYSRFDYNGLPNPNCKAGEFKLEIEGGMEAFTAPRPDLVHITSASTERNALINDNAAARMKDIPIVQLNPAGTLNWKYKGEMAVRSSGLSYAIVRPTGLVNPNDKDPDAEKAYTLEFCQGDAIAGRVCRKEVAAVVQQAMAEPAAVDTTFEIRRTDRWAVGGQVAWDGSVPKSEFLRLVQDRDRRKVGLQPVPAFVPPPEPVTEERKAQILSDPRVKEQQARRKGETVEQEIVAPATAAGTASADMAIALRKAAVKQWIADYRERAAAEPAGAEAAVSEEDTAAAIAERKAAAQEWIATWRAKPPPPAPAPTAQQVAAAKADAQAWIGSWRQKSEVREWIANWRAKPAPVPANLSDKAEAQAWIANWRAANQNGAKNGAKAKLGAKVKVGAR